MKKCDYCHLSKDTNDISIIVVDDGVKNICNSCKLKLYPPSPDRKKPDEKITIQKFQSTIPLIRHQEKQLEVLEQIRHDIHFISNVILVLIILFFIVLFFSVFIGGVL